MFVEKHCGPKFKITTDKYTFVVANNYKLNRKINWLKNIGNYLREVVTGHLIQKGSGVNLIFLSTWTGFLVSFTIYYPVGSKEVSKIGGGASINPGITLLYFCLGPKYPDTPHCLEIIYYVT